MFGQSPAGRLIEACDARFDIVTRTLGNGKTSGFLCVRSTASKAMILKPYGEIPNAKRHRYSTLSMEKSTRLEAYPSHKSSWQSRDVELNRWGGAVRTPTMLVSFSGLPELLDEALVLAISARALLITEFQAEDIARISNNPFFEQTMRLVI